ncbi:MAG: phage major capsid protein [Planctomycetaceae bacterium]
MPAVATGNLQDMKKERAELVGVIKGFQDVQTKENRSLNAEEQKTFDDAWTRQAELKRNIDNKSRYDHLEKEFNDQQERKRKKGTQVNGDPLDKTRSRDFRREQEVTPEDQRNATAAWLKRQFGIPLKREEKLACRKLNFSPSRQDLNIPLSRSEQIRSFYSESGQRNLKHGQPVEQRSMTTTTLASGGALVPPIPDDYVFMVEVALLQWSQMRSVATIIRSAKGGDYPVPTINDTANEGTLVGEGASIGTVTDPATGVKNIPLYKLSSKPIQFSPEMIEDSPFDVLGFLFQTMGERLGRGSNRYYTTGTANSQPAGIVPGSYLGKTSASTSAIADTELIDLIFSVDSAYRLNSRLMMSDAIAAYIMKIKVVADGTFQWQPSYQAGTPDRISGTPIIYNNYMATAIASTARTVLAGDFSKFFIRESSLRVRKFAELYGASDLDAVCGFMRVGSVLVDAGTHPIRHLVH